MPGRSDGSQRVTDVVEAINRAWREGGPEEIREHLHEEVVFHAPGFQAKAHGREACLESYRDFAEQAEIQSYEERERTVDLTGRVAVVTYRFEMSYRMGGHHEHDSGRDILVLERDGERWLLVWRTLVPDHVGEGHA